LAALISRLRDAGAVQLRRHIRDEHAGLAAAILLGIREEVDASRTEDFFRTGTVHLLAISGLHVGILAYGFWTSLRCVRVSRRTMLWAAIFLVHFYVQLTEARPPVVRASILITCMCLARLSGRKNQPANTLALAGIVVLVWNPNHLFQTGPQLSFLAVAALLCARDWLQKPYLPKDPLDRLILQTRAWPRRCAGRLGHAVVRLWAVSALIWVASLPLVMLRFRLVSPVALVVNPLVSLPMAVALFSGFGVLLSGWICPPLASLCGTVCDRSLAFIARCVQVSLAIRGGHFWTPPPPLWWVFGFYLGAAIWASSRQFRPPRRWCFALVVLWLIVGVGLTRSRRVWQAIRQPPCLTCTFIAVGHGTSVLLESPDGKTLLYDAGHRGISAFAAQSIAGVLWSRGILHLDGIVVSHADADHFNALPDLLERFSVGAVFVSPQMFHEDVVALRELRQTLVAAAVPLRELAAGDRLWPQADVAIGVLHPPVHGEQGSDNANSLVLRVDYQGRTLLLPGDLEAAGLQRLLNQPPLDSDIVMAPHHGSARSNPVGFAAWARPEWVVISGDAGHDAREVRDAYRAAGSRTLHTAKRGAVQFVIDAKGIDVRTWRDDPW
jgi:competence protein ComEC